MHLLSKKIYINNHIKSHLFFKTLIYLTSRKSKRTYSKSYSWRLTSKPFTEFQT